MNSLNVNFIAGFGPSKAKGISGSADLKIPLRESNLSTSLSSTGSGASLANKAYGPQTRTLVGAANEEIDWTTWTSILGETAQTFATGIRLFYILHLTASLASTITVGNASGNKWLPFSWPSTGTMTFKPGEGIVMISRTTSGLLVDGTHKLFKVLNDHATLTASYRIGAFGS